MIKRHWLRVHKEMGKRYREEREGNKMSQM